MQKWHLKLVASDSAIFARLTQMLDERGVVYSVDAPNRLVVEGERAGDVEDMLGEEIYDLLFGPHLRLTCDDHECEQETRDYIQQHGIPFVEHCFDDDVAFVLSRQHDPDKWS